MLLDPFESLKPFYIFLSISPRVRLPGNRPRMGNFHEHFWIALQGAGPKTHDSFRRRLAPTLHGEDNGDKGGNMRHVIFDGHSR
jgi:hypothetical protein